MWNLTNIKNKDVNNAAYSDISILGKDEKELYKEIDNKTAEKYGRHSLAYQTITNRINIKLVTGAQFFWLLNVNDYLPQYQRLISLKDMELITDSNQSFFTGFYSYVPEVILRSEAPVNPKEKYILEDFIRQMKNEKFNFSPEQPLRISGLELVKDENPDNAFGLLIKITNDTKFTTDKRFAHSNSGKAITFGKKTKKIWTGKKGLSAICQGGGSYLYTDGGFEIYADCVCRVVLIESN